MSMNRFFIIPFLRVNGDGLQFPRCDVYPQVPEAAILVDSGVNSALRVALYLAFSALTLPAATVIRCGSMLDVRKGELIPNAVIVVDKGVIQGVNIPQPHGAEVIDLSRGTCMPGLMDVHDHLTVEPTQSAYESLGVSIPRQAIAGVKNARLTLRAGFTAVRNVGAAGYSDVALRDGINAGEVEGPRLFVPGPPLGITGGHCDNNLLAPEFKFRDEGVADGPWEARRKVREVIKYGADLIKVCASGGVLSKGDSPGAPQYTLEELTAIVEEAHKLGRKVAAHAHGTQSIKNSIRAGHRFGGRCQFDRRRRNRAGQAARRVPGLRYL